MMITKSDRKLAQQLQQIVHISPEEESKRRSIWYNWSVQRKTAVANGIQARQQFDKLFAGRKLW